MAAHSSGPGLLIQITDYVTSPIVMDLGVTDPQTFDLFKVWTSENDVANPEDTNNKPISVSFNFSSPSPNNVDPVTGETDGVRQLFGIIQYGRLRWDDPDGPGGLNPGQTQFTWGAPGNQGLMTISLSDGDFGAGPIFNGEWVGYTVRGTFDWDFDPVAVPEPGTWALMIGGFGMAGAMFRRRRALAAT